MTSATAQDVKAFIVSTLNRQLGYSVTRGATFPDDFDLRGGGVIDSLGFLKLVGELEAHFNCAISFEDVPPERLTILGFLCGHVTAQVTGASIAGTGPRELDRAR